MSLSSKRITVNPDDQPTVVSSLDEDDDSESWKDARDQFLDDYTNVTSDNGISNGLNNHDTDQSLQDKTNSQQTNKSDSDDLRLHEAIFNNDLRCIHDILMNKDLAKELVNKKDKHGNTPLHLACMVGQPKEVIEALLKRGASVETKNLNRWTPFHEACSYGNRDIITVMTIQLGNNFHESLNHEKLAKQLMKQRDYKVTLKWEFRSWVPFLSKVLPNDVCVINKQGGNIRIDTRLLEVGSEYMPLKRTDGCLIYSSHSKKKWIIMNKKTKQYQYISFGQKLNRHLDFKVDDFMSTDIIDIELESKDIVLTRSTSGWIWKAEKAEKIGKFDAALYEFNNVFLVTRKRREHLSDEDLKRNKIFNKSAMDMLKFGKKPDEVEEVEADEGNTSEDLDEDEPESHRPSLSPPPKPEKSLSWADYLASEPGKHPTLGREHKIKITKTPFKAGLAVSDQFPITKEEFIDLLSIIPLKLFKKLKDFIEMRLPDGFPIRVDVPIFSFLAARITLEDFEFLNGPVDDSLFKVPDDYEEETTPMLPIFHSRSRDTA